MRRLPLVAVGLLALALAAVVDRAGARGAKQGVQLTDEQFTKFVNAEGKFLQETLAKGKPDKKTTRKILASSMLIIAYAANCAHADKLGVGANAVELHNAVVAGNVDLAKALAAAFYPAIQPRKDKLKEDLKATYNELMYFFASERVGGFAVEKELGELEEQKDKYSPTDFNRLTELAHKSAIIGVMAPVYPPEFDTANKTEKNWLRFSGEFTDAAQTLTKAATAKDEAGARKALESLNKKCVQCHDVFR